MRKKAKSKKAKIRKHLTIYVFSFKNLCLSVFICGLIVIFSSNIFSQKTALLTPEKTSQSELFAEQFETSLSKHLDVIDLSLAESVLQIKNFATPYNLTSQEAKNLGISIGCNFFIIIKTDNQRRSSFEKAEYYESFATLYLVSSRTGRLVFWKHQTFEEGTLAQAKTKLFSSINDLAFEISNKLKSIGKKELNETDEQIAEFPDVDSPEAKGLRPPLPFKRIKPKYTNLAALYNVIATVDVLVDIDEDGKVSRTEIVRWAGFGLDESVIKTVNKMNWRPADQDGKRLPMRILLRYNFRNIETDR